MLSVIVFAYDIVDANGEMRVARTLSSLVPFAVDGLVRDVHLCVKPQDRTLDRLADEAGANLHSDRSALIGALKSEFVLVLQAGCVLPQALGDDIANALQSGAIRHGAVLCWRGQTWWQQIFVRKIGGVIAPRAVLAKGQSLSPKHIKRHLSAPLVIKTKLEGH